MNRVTPFLRVSGLSKHYGERPVVNDATFGLQAGGFLSLLGPSGSGKSTILRMIAGLIRPNRGTIRFGDQVVFADGREVPAEERGVGMVFQDYALWPHMTAAQNIAFGLRVARMPSATRPERVRNMLALVDLVGMERRYPHQLSGGQQQRLALARALATQPKILLLDEPLSSLDTGLRQTMREELLRIVRTANITVINVTHDQDEAMAISDEIVLLRDGRIQQQGTPEILYHNPANSFVARLMGPANVVEGQVVSVSGDRVALRRGDWTLLARSNRSIEGRVGDSAAVLCRPENVTTREAHPAELENTVLATVTSATFGGSRWTLRMTTPLGFDLSASSPRGFGPGTELWATLPNQHCVLVDAD